MARKLIAVVIMMAGLLVAASCKRKAAEPIAWYGMKAHPYINEVQAGVEAFEKDNNVSVRKMVGQEWTQENENVNVKAMSTSAHKAFSIYPGDAVGCRNLFETLKKNNQMIVAYGAEPELPTPATFTVATNIKGAAKFACAELIKMMDAKGGILNVLETSADINTKKRDEGINEVVAEHKDTVKIVQTIKDVSEVESATNAIKSALATRSADIDGIITTGYNPTIAAAAVLTEWHKDPSHKRIRFVGIDTGPTVLQAIREGHIDATVAQNPFGHGYVSCTILKMLLDGWTPKQPYQYIDAGIVLVNKGNVDTYSAEVRKITDGIIQDLKTKYMDSPKGK